MRFCLEPTTLNREAAVLTGSGVEQKSMRGHTNGDDAFFQVRGVLSELSKNESYAAALLEGESKAASQAATKQTYTVSATLCHVQAT